MKQRMADPAIRERQTELTRAGIARSLQDPAMLELRREMGRVYGAKNIETTRSAEVRAKAGKAISDTKLAHIPPSLRAEYRELVRKRGLSAAEAERIVIQSAEQCARREIAKADAKMRAKDERRKAEAY